VPMGKGKKVNPIQRRVRPNPEKEKTPSLRPPGENIYPAQVFLTRARQHGREKKDQTLFKDTKLSDLRRGPVIKGSLAKEKMEAERLRKILKGLS